MIISWTLEGVENHPWPPPFQPQEQPPSSCDNQTLPCVPCCCWGCGVGAGGGGGSELPPVENRRFKSTEPMVSFESYDPGLLCPEGIIEIISSTTLSFTNRETEAGRGEWPESLPYPRLYPNSISLCSWLCSQTAQHFGHHLECCVPPPLPSPAPRTRKTKLAFCGW